MELRSRVETGLKRAMKEKDSTRICTLRLISAAIKDLEIAKRGCEEDPSGEISDAEIMGILTKMVRQRAESVQAYEEAGRLELAEQERQEAEIIGEFLPKPLSDSEQAAAIAAAIADSGAGSLRDMGRVMNLLKERHAGRIDLAAAGPAVRERLAS